MATVAATAIIGAALLGAAPANAQRYSGPGGIEFSYGSGGYCDDSGCPDDFWDYPVYYCPVFYDGDWYKGPVYYRDFDGRNLFWVHGEWRRDEWRGARPLWACTDRVGPPLGFEFYQNHGFRMRAEWRDRWRRHHDSDRGDWRGNNRGGNDRGNWRGDDRRGVRLAGGGEDHRAPAGVAGVGLEARVAALLESRDQLAGGLAGDAEDGAEFAGRQRPARDQPQHGGVAAAVVGVTEFVEALRHRPHPAATGEREQVAEQVRGA